VPAGAPPEEPSSLGRYAPPAGDAPLATVRLLNLPVQLFAAAREHHDALMREFRLIALSGRLGSGDAPPRLVEMTRILGETYGASAPRSDERFDAAIASGALTMDLEEHVPAAAGEAIRAVGELMTEADRFCAAELLMTMPRPPLLKAFGDWYVGEYEAQIAGRAAEPWKGPLTLDGPDPGRA
jgi:hypothetical protein